MIIWWLKHIYRYSHLMTTTQLLLCSFDDYNTTTAMLILWLKHSNIYVHLTTTTQLLLCSIDDYNTATAMLIWWLQHSYCYVYLMTTTQLLLCSFDDYSTVTAIHNWWLNTIINMHIWCLQYRKRYAHLITARKHTSITTHIQDVTGGTDQTSGECSLC